MMKLRILLPMAFACLMPLTAHGETHPLPGVAALDKCEFLKRTCANSSTHVGVDFMTAPGTPVRAMCDGTVKLNTTSRSDINSAFLIVEHMCSGKKVFGYYGHIASSIGENRPVTEGQVIGTVRDWQRNSHLHMGMARSYYTSGWGYQNSAMDFFDFRTLLNNKPATPTKPNPPVLVREQQSGSNVGLAWQEVRNGTNYRIHIAPEGTRWTPDTGFSSTVVDSTTVTISKGSVAYLWSGARAGRYQYTVRVNIQGTGASDFAAPKSFTVR